MKAIVTTTINPITKAIQRFQEMQDWTLVVAGDLKTPRDYALERGIYLTPANQDEIDKDLSDLVGWNCIQRRNFAILKALKMGAEIICLVDDDNIPLDNWGKNLYLTASQSFKSFETQEVAFDPIGATNHGNLWHRGFPLQLIPNRRYLETKTIQFKPSIQADFWNGDPDIDAICRMQFRPECDFDDKDFPFTSNAMAPFNSQNTFLTREAAVDYFLFPHIGRMDDIWAAYYVQALGHTVVFGAPTVYQERNPHNLIEDMKKEYIGYENNLKLIYALRENPDSIETFLPERSKKAWQRYREIVSNL